MLIFIMILVSPAEPQDANCRCLDRTFCLTGELCLDYQCGRGWQGAPLCRTPCSNSTFGINCKFTCHCQDDVECNPVSGFCLCHEEWGGAGCQTRLPRLVKAPWAGNITCNMTIVYWLPWSPNEDVGDTELKITSYRVEVCINGSMKCSKLTGNMTREGSFESVQFLVEDPWSSYEFRVLTIWSDFNKAMDGLVGPRSTPVTPGDHCQGPTERIETTKGQMSTIKFLSTSIKTTIKMETTTQQTTTSAMTPRQTPSGPAEITLLWSNEFTLSFGWLSRVPESVQVIQYKIIYSIYGSPAKKNYILSGNNETKFNLTNLAPGTSYEIQMQAQVFLDVNDGWSLLSNPVVFQTLDGQPGPPRDLNRTLRNESCISVVWKAPLLINGFLTGFNVTCQPISAATASFSMTLTKGVSDMKATFCGLAYATLYKVSVLAQNRNQFGPPASVEIWTSVGQPSSPPNPVVLAVTNLTVTLRIEPVVLNTGPLSGYYIVVKINASDVIAKRSVESELNAVDPAKDLNLEGYTCAWLNPDQVVARSNFTVGDGKVYGYFSNRELETNKYYVFYYVVSSSLDGDTKMSFSQTLQPVKALQPADEISTLSLKTESPPQIDLKVLAVTISLLVLLILALILLFYFCYWRKRFVSEKDEDKVILGDSSLVTFDGQYQTTKKWSDVWSLEAFRRPIYSDDYGGLERALQSANQPPISIEEEFERLPSESMFACEVAKETENRSKNRFEHILAYDHTRVKLRNCLGSDYINANYIFGNTSKGGKTYIAAQSPFSPQTICDFWSMIYCKKISAIIFLSKLMEDNVVKCEQYWPEDDYLRKYGKIFVLKKGTQKFANFIIRTFEISISSNLHDNKSFTLKQYHFLSWNSSNHLLNILEFWRKVRLDASSSCWLVHCSTGISRTAVFLAFDSCLRSSKRNKLVNVFQTCLNMRGSRPSMVRSLKHYHMIYDLLFEALQIPYKEQFIDHNNMATLFNELKHVDTSTKLCSLKEQFHLLEKFSSRPNEKLCSVGMSPQNKKKNRFSTVDFIPRDEDRVRLHKLENSNQIGEAATQSYINALFLNSYEEKHFLIITQSPLSETVADFWQMIYETNSLCVINMNHTDLTNTSCASYIPHEEKSLAGNFDVELLKTESHENFEVKRLKLIHNSLAKEEIREILHYRFKSWKACDRVPTPRGSILEMIQNIHQVRGSVVKTPIIIHCADGASQSGLLGACFILHEIFLRDKSINIFHVIKYLKSKRFPFINSYVQYSFCFKFLWDVMNKPTHS